MAVAVAVAACGCMWLVAGGWWLVAVGLALGPGLVVINVAFILKKGRLVQTDNQPPE